MRDLEDPTQSGGANCSKVEIRQATAADADLILALHQESANDTDAFDSSHLGEATPLDVPADLQHFAETYLGSIHNRFWVAVLPNQPATAQDHEHPSAQREPVIERKILEKIMC